MSFTLLHTNDFHNKLSQAQADRLRLLRESVGEAGLLLDAGDAVGAGNVTFNPVGEPILDKMSRAGYDAMTVGNREFHISRYGFHSKLSCAKFPVLCANVRPSRSKEEPVPLTSNSGNESARADNADPPVVPYIYREMRSGWRVVVLGLTVSMVTERMAARHLSAYLFSDPIRTAMELAPRLRQEYKPDLLIALTHIGLRQDRKLAEAVPEIDLIIGGHSHDRLEQGEQVGHTLICQTGSYGHHFGRVVADRGNDGTLILKATLEPLTAQVNG